MWGRAGALLFSRPGGISAPDSFGPSFHFRFSFVLVLVLNEMVLVLDVSRGTNTNGSSNRPSLSKARKN